MKNTLTNLDTSTEMESNSTKHIAHESTYALLVRSEEKSRTVIETVIYALFIFSSMAAIWQLALQPIELPLTDVASVAGSSISVSKHQVRKSNVHG